MYQVILSDEGVKEALFPFAQIGSVSSLRIGILTIREKWEYLLNNKMAVLDSAESGIPVNFYSSAIIPDFNFIKSYVELGLVPDPTDSSVRKLQYPWQIMQWNDEQIRSDFELITRGRKSMPVPPTVQTIGTDQIFIEPGARLQYCTLNASTGPIYIGKDSEIMEGSLIRGPFALCTGSIVKMGSVIYGATTVGPYSVVGGEIKNSVFQSYSNKAHHGYLGDSVIGTWCNLGAGCTNSNLKNTAGGVKVWYNKTGEYIHAGLKCGLLMGDYSVAAINCSFNTGTVVGLCANIFGTGLLPKFIPSFSWGMNRYEFEKALTHIGNWKKLKNKNLSSEEIQKLKLIFENI